MFGEKDNYMLWVKECLKCMGKQDCSQLHSEFIWQNLLISPFEGNSEYYIRNSENVLGAE